MWTAGLCRGAWRRVPALPLPIQTPGLGLLLWAWVPFVHPNPCQLWMGPRVPRSGCNLWAVFPSHLCPRRTMKGELAMPEEGWAPAPMSAQMQCLPGCVGGWGPEHRLWACGNGDPTGATGRQGGSPPWSFPPPLTGSDGGGMAASAALALPVLSVWSQVCACVCLRSHDGHVCACVCACAGGGAVFPAQTASSLGPLGIRLLAPSPHLCLGPFRLRGPQLRLGRPSPLLGRPRGLCGRF